MNSFEFRPGTDDPIAYDRQTLAVLLELANPAIVCAVELLQDGSYVFPSMEKLHKDAIDLELLYRQCIPAAAIGARLGYAAEQLGSYLAIFASGQTLILNHIDRHLDLSNSYTLRDPKLLLQDVHSVMCYSIAQLYRTMIMGSFSPESCKALHRMAGVSLNIIQSMYDNYESRFRLDYLESPELVCSLYENPVRSRHLGSGFYASSILGLYAYVGRDLPPGLSKLTDDMRRLRQRVDELSDVFEDVATGLISYPVAKLLISTEYHRKAVDLIQKMWNRSRTLMENSQGDAATLSSKIFSDGLLSEVYSELMDLLLGSWVMAECYSEASELWASVRVAAKDCLDTPVAEVVSLIVDLKRAFLERLAQAAWVDESPGYTLMDIVQERKDSRDG